MKVELIAAMSLNGKIAASSDQSSLEWTSKEDTKFFVEKTKECRVMIMGRKTFDTIGRALKDRLIVVMTCDPEKHALIEGVEYTCETPHQILKDLESRGYASVAIAGGAGVYSMFLKEKLVTDVFLSIEPILFGNGISLAESFEDVKLKLVESKQLGEQTVLLHYEVV
ncbi:MAG: dihydrofolate reductase family protein [Candidatus Uhrbacteria bacterium]|nr:dihydrofolate reductase family protein [Candidatus Uhrbacteria bacterium]